MQKRYFFLTFAFVLILCTSANSQSDSTALSTNSQTDSSEFSFDLTADIVSRYVWRGMNLSESPSFQPEISVSYKNFTLGSWGSYSLSKEPLQEVDLFLSWESDYVSLTLNDYYNPYDSLGGTDDYFQWNNSTTRHALEGVLTLNGPETFPMALEAGIMFFGNDKNADGNNAYSTYIELNYTAEHNGVEYKPFLGFTTAEGYYGDKAGFVNLGVSATKNIAITDKFELPLNIGFIVNPQKEKVFLVLGFTF